MHISAISISPRTGMRKENTDSVELRCNHGIVGDAHAGKWHRQVSLLAQESIDTMVAAGLDVRAGNFAENITTTGIDLSVLRVGQRIALGDQVELAISQLGKVCHSRCAIYYQAGDCVMPRDGIFGVVLREGKIQVGDPIRIQDAPLMTSAAILGTAEQEATLGAALAERIMQEEQPAFIRYDRVQSDGANLGKILADLVELQKVSSIFLLVTPDRQVLDSLGAQAQGRDCWRVRDCSIQIRSAESEDDAADVAQN